MLLLVATNAVAMMTTATTAAAASSVAAALPSLPVNAAAASSSSNNDNDDDRHRSMLELQSLSRTLHVLQLENALSDHTLRVLHSLERRKNEQQQQQQQQQHYTTMTSWLRDMERNITRDTEQLQRRKDISQRRRLTATTTTMTTIDDKSKEEMQRKTRSHLRRRSGQSSKDLPAALILVRDEERKLGRGVGIRHADLQSTASSKMVIATPTSSNEIQGMIDSSSDEEASIVQASVITMNNDDGWLQDVTFDDDDHVVELCYPIIDHGQMITFNENDVENTDSDEDTHNKNTKDNDERILSNTYYIYDYHAAKSSKYNNNGKSGKKYGRSGSNTDTTDAADPLVTQNNNINDDDDDESVEEEIILVMPSSSNTIFAKSSKMSKGAKAGETKSGKACIIVEEGDEDDNDEEEKEDEEEEEKDDEEEAEEEEEEVDTEDDDEKDVNDNEEEEDDDETSTPTSMPTSTCTKGCIDCDPESPLPCPPSNLKRICDKDNADGNFFDCYESCKVSFCCIHDSLSKEYSPSCSKEYDNCPLYYPCYIIWWKLHDTIGPATYLRLEQNEPFYDGLDFDRLENDLAKDQQFFQQLFGHHFDTDDAPTDDTFEDENNW